MHVPDGFLDLPTSLLTGAISAAGVGVALNRSRRELGTSGPLRAGLTACFVFAAQMVNFPVGAGTSGHLLGGALAAALVGPWTAVLAMTCVLLVQALFFADGGLTALGTNVLLMGLLPVAVATLCGRPLARVLRRVTSPRTAVLAAATVGATLSVPVAAAAFTALYAVGGAVPLPLSALGAAMVGTHLLIGVGEGAITGAVLATVLAARPDLVHLARATGPAARLRVTDPAGRTTWVPADPSDAGADAPARRLGARGAGVALAAASVVAGGLSLAAATTPDGLESVATRLGFDSAAMAPATAGSPLADYGVGGLGPVGTTLAGLTGVAVTLALSLTLTAVLTRRHDGPPA